MPEGSNAALVMFVMYTLVVLALAWFSHRTPATSTSPIAARWNKATSPSNCSMMSVASVNCGIR